MSTRTPTSAWQLLVVDATSGVPLVAGLINLAAASFAGVTLSSTPMLPGWGDPLNACLSACFFLCPISAGAAAVHAGWLERSGMAGLAATAPDGRWRPLLLTAAGSWLWAVAAYACLVLVVLLTSDLSGPWSPAMLLLPAQGVVLLAVGVLVGVLAGTVGRYVWVPPVVATVIFVALNYLDRTDGPLDGFSMTYSFVFYQVNLVPNVMLLAGAMLSALGVGVLMLAAIRMTVRRRLAPVLTVVACAALGAGVVVVDRAGVSDVDFRAGGTARCAMRGPVELCVFAESEAQLVPMVHALARARATAEPLFAVPREFRQPLVATRQQAPVPVDVPSDAERFGYLGRAVEAVVPGAVCSTPHPERDALVALVYERLTPGIVESRAVRELATEPLRAQREWAAPRVERLLACS